MSSLNDFFASVFAEVSTDEAMGLGIGISYAPEVIDLPKETRQVNQCNDQTGRRSGAACTNKTGASADSGTQVIDGKVQEDTHRVKIKKGISGWFLTTKKPLNLVSEEEASGILTFDFKVNRKSEEPLIFTSVCGENCNVSLDMKEFFGKLSLGNWNTIGVPLKCLKQNGLNLQKITVPMGLLSSGEWQFDIGKVYLEGGEGGKHIYPCN